ncbi:uncharacterized protein LOC135818510 [Sycon ciliatum]|uniref:uncharacterized protein LOC135818510 n=1 Tax=Sycon ciliatum TaxID=27933 RepID=UPI0031F6E5B6
MYSPLSLHLHQPVDMHGSGFGRHLLAFMLVTILTGMRTLSEPLSPEDTGSPLHQTAAYPIQPVPEFVLLPTDELGFTRMVLINQAVMFRESNRSMYTPHLMYMYKHFHGETAYLGVAVYETGYLAGLTWQVFEREINLSRALGPECCCFWEIIPSVALSPSREHIFLHGFGPGECNNRILVYGDRTARVMRPQQHSHSRGITTRVEDSGSALVSVRKPSARAGNSSGSAGIYLLSFGGCSWQDLSPKYGQCKYSSSILHRMLVHTNHYESGGEWERVKATGPKAQRSRPFLSLFPDGDTSFIFVGGWKPVGGPASGTVQMALEFWRFDLLSWTWFELENNHFRSVHLRCSLTSPDVSYLASSRTVLIKDESCSYPCVLIVCDIGTRSVDCTTPSVPVYSRTLRSRICHLHISSGIRSFIFASPKGNEMIMVDIYKTIENNRTTSRPHALNLEPSYKFPGFIDGSSPFRTAAVKAPVSSTEESEFMYVFFGRNSVFMEDGQDSYYASQPAYSFPMAMWILRAYSSTQLHLGLGQFEYTLFYPKPGPVNPRRQYHTVSLITNTTVVMYGGYETRSDGKVVGDMDPYPWCFNLKQHFWVEATVPTRTTPPPRGEHISFRYNSTAMVVHGGLDPVSSDVALALGDLWMFIMDDEDLCTGRWHNLTAHVMKGSLPSQYGHTATVTEYGVLLFGGFPSVPSLSRLTFVDIRSASNVVVHDIPSSPSIPSRWAHSLAFANDKDLVLLGGANKRFHMYSRDADWALLLQFTTTGTLTVATWTPFFKERITHHIVLDDMVFGGMVDGLCNNDGRGVRHFIQLNTATLCPRGYERDQNNACRACSLGYYSSTLQEPCIECNQSLTSTDMAATYCVPESPCKPHTCNQHGDCIVDEENFKHACICQFGYLPSDDCKTPMVYLILVAALMFTIVGTSLVISLIQFLRKRRALHAKEIELVNTNRDLYRSKRKLSQIDHGTRIAWSDLRIRKQLATGRFCKVLLAELGDIPVAVKQLPPFVSTESPYDAFIQEAEVLRTLRHPNIVMFLGAGRDKRSGRPFLVMEYLRRGSLYDVLHDQSNAIEQSDRLRFSLDAARGVRYLHNTSPPRIHRDLKSANLLVSDKWVVKVADMETTRFLAILHANAELNKTSTPTGAEQTGHGNGPIRTTSFTSQQQQQQQSDGLTAPLLSSASSDVNHSDPDMDRNSDAEAMTSRIGMTCGVGTDRWRSPESIKKNMYTEKHDVYSFGVVMWELSTRRIPYGHLHNSDDILDEISSGGKLVFPPSIPYAYRHLAEQCIKADPEERPQMHRVVHELTTQLDAI